MMRAGLSNISPSGSSKEYNQQLFIWIDILGFSSIVEDEVKYTELANILDNFKNAFTKLQGCQADIISDGIIINIDISDRDTISKVFKSIGEKQYEFILKDRHFIRGGIAVGSRLKQDQENKSYISNGLARAVKIENTKINWPIVGTNKNHLNEIREKLNIQDPEENFNLIKCFNKNGEDIYFIDFINEENESFYNLIDSKIAEYKKETSVRDKYVWLLRYYHHKFKQPLQKNCLDGWIL
ncbi:hypothetical protein [Geovibrio ferrireducens]|uniref:hypothetical protein n=1 Tax=Geovibrio ferrireducens TaxID=46201 RepID=UPI0022483B96|nr:hypothetical protein [Geovibrio ferrireducens]